MKNNSESPPLYVGEEVKCIQTHISLRGDKFVQKNEKYTVKEVKQCTCGKWAVYVGVIARESFVINCECGAKVSSSTQIWHSPDRFKALGQKELSRRSRKKLRPIQKKLEEIEKRIKQRDSELGPIQKKLDELEVQLKRANEFRKECKSKAKSLPGMATIISASEDEVNSTIRLKEECVRCKNELKIQISTLLKTKENVEKTLSETKQKMLMVEKFAKIKSDSVNLSEQIEEIMLNAVKSISQ